MNKLRKQALAAGLAVMGLGTIGYGYAVVIMADTAQEGAAAAGACCLPLALLFFIGAYVLWAEAGAQ